MRIIILNSNIDAMIPLILWEFSLKSRLVNDSENDCMSAGNYIFSLWFAIFFCHLQEFHIFQGSLLEGNNGTGNIYFIKYAFDSLYEYLVGNGRQSHMDQQK